MMPLNAVYFSRITWFWNRAMEILLLIHILSFSVKLTKHTHSCKIETGQCDELSVVEAIILLSPVPAVLPACHSQLEFKNYWKAEREGTRETAVWSTLYSKVALNFLLCNMHLTE